MQLKFDVNYGNACMPKKPGLDDRLPFIIRSTTTFLEQNIFVYPSRIIETLDE